MTVTPPGKDYNLFEAMMDFESGDMTEHHDLIRLFSRLIKTGMAWKLQGSYGRAAKALIDSDAIAPNGDILQDPDDEEESDVPTNRDR